VYQRNVKIYNGIDNTIEFDIKNADQKRIDLATLTQIELNIMDAQGNALENSPYTVTPTALKGIAAVTIPQEDLTELSSQYLKYSVTALKDGNDVMLYADSRFGAVGKFELVGDAMPTFRNEKVYDRFSGEIDLMGNVKNHTSAIPCKFYEAIPTSEMSFDITYTDYTGEMYIEATKDSTISVESFNRNGVKLITFTPPVGTGTFTQSFTLPVGDYNYFRVVWTYLDPTLLGLYGASPTGTVDKVVVN